MFKSHSSSFTYNSLTYHTTLLTDDTTFFKYDLTIDNIIAALLCFVYTRTMFASAITAGLYNRDDEIAYIKINSATEYDIAALVFTMSAILKEKHTWVKTVRIVDEVPDATMSIALHGDTWYGRRFGAVPVSMGDAALYRERTGRLTTAAYKMDWEHFVIHAKIAHNVALQQILEPAYTATRTLREFFELLATNDFASIFSVPAYTGELWGDVFMRHILGGDVKKWQFDIR